MNRISLLAIGTLLFMACGGDDGNHSSAKCGDGVVDTGEQCDDGNTSSGDGCSSTCQNETHGGTCGDGIVDVATETCDDGNTTSGDGCSATCQTETVNKCGNGHLDTGEACDDNNTASGDGCSATCTVEAGYMCSGEPSVCMVMTQTADGTCAAPFTATLTALGSTYVAMGAGDTTNATNQVAAGTCDMEDMSGAGHDQIWKIVNPMAQPVLITIHHDTTDFDAVLRLTTTACDVSTQVPDDLLPDDQEDGTSDGCADLHGSSSDERLNYNNLAAGTYYLVVDGYFDDDNGMYSFSVQAGTATCGNGVVEVGEGCDDHNTTVGDGCDASCAVESGYSCTGSPSVCTSLCGNGVLDPGETCDDHNTAAGDGCDATCAVETGYVCTGAPSTCHLTVCGDGVVEGAEACDDHNLATGDGCDGSCQVETGWSCNGSPSTCMFGGTCASPFPLTLTLSGGVYTATGSSDDSHATNQVDAAACDTESSAGGAPDQQWSFVNPVAQPVTITLTPTGFDGLVRLMTTACDVTTQILDDDSGGTSDGCSDVQGSGTAEVLTYNNLPAGTYYIDADGYSAAESGAYTIAIHAGSACGDGLVEGSEECDSGGVTNTYCTADCHLVFDTTDTEANDDFAHAQTVTPAHHIIEGALAVGDLDVYQFTLTAASVVSVETYTTYASGYTSTTSDSPVPHLSCPLPTDTIASIFDGTGDVTDDGTALVSDDDGGDQRCSYATSATLAPGTYYFAVHEYELDNVISRYLVELNVTPM